LKNAIVPTDKYISINKAPIREKHCRLLVVTYPLSNAHCTQE